MRATGEVVVSGSGSATAGPGAGPEAPHPYLGPGAPAAARVAGALGAVSVLGVLAGTALMGLLHLVPPSSAVDPVRRTLSEYALGPNAWLFNLAVVLVAAGSALLLGVLVGRGVIRPLSLATLGLTAWTVSLAMLVVFTKHNWAQGPSAGGHVHRVFSVVAFLSLPVAAIVAGRAGGRQGRPAHWLGWTSLLCFLPIVAAIVAGSFGDTPWWRVIPLGLVERLLLLNEVAALVALGVLALAGARRPLTSAADRESL